jgi:hypothetical protein
MFRNYISVLLALSSAMMVFAAPTPIPDADLAPTPGANGGYFVSSILKPSLALSPSTP